MDVNLLAALREKSKFRQLRAAVPDSMLGAETIAMLGWYKAYFDAFPDKSYVETAALRSLFTLRAGDSASPEQLAVMRALMNKLDEPVDAGILEGITSQLYERDFAGRAAALLNAYENGDEVDLTYELGKMSSETMRRLSQSAPSSYIDTPIEDILGDFQDDRGIKLPTQALKNSVGKTSLGAAILTHAAPQLRDLGWAGRPILWFNNEGVGKRIIPRIYQAALGIDFAEMVKLSNEGKLRDLYLQAVDGQEIRVKDMHGASLGQLEQVVEEMNPCICVFDMVANFKLPGAAGGGNKTDSLEQGWQEIREMGVRHDALMFGTIQISDLGDNMLFPGYNALKDSRTGVQGALDVQLMMGALNSPDMASLRGLSTPKNKRQIVGKPSYVQAQVYFDSATCQFTDGND
jgi:hypothetical protein